MLNRIYNIIIYTHFAQRAIDEYLRGVDSAISEVWSNDHNILPEHLKEYLNEKSSKYLGLDVDSIDHNKIFCIIYGTLMVEEINVLVDYFEPRLSEIRNYENLFPEETDDSIVHGWVIKQAKIVGADHWLTIQIIEYVNNISETERKELIRDLQIKNLIQ
jgi:hypothetical protein